MVASSCASASASFGLASWVKACSAAGSARPAARVPSGPKAVLDRGGPPRARTAASTARPRRGLPGPASSSCGARAARSRARSYTTAARRRARRSRSPHLRRRPQRLHRAGRPHPRPRRRRGHVLRARDRGSRKGAVMRKHSATATSWPTTRCGTSRFPPTRAYARPCLHRGGDGLSALCVSAPGRRLGLERRKRRGGAATGCRRCCGTSTPGTGGCPAGAIYNRVVGGAHPGAIVVMHDGGGNRAQTLAALPHIVSTLTARGYKLVTVTRLLGERFVVQEDRRRRGRRRAPTRSVPRPVEPRCGRGRSTD